MYYESGAKGYRFHPSGMSLVFVLDRGVMAALG
jgi:hypothetical protein